MNEPRYLEEYLCNMIIKYDSLFCTCKVINQFSVKLNYQYLAIRFLLIIIFLFIAIELYHDLIE